MEQQPVPGNNPPARTIPQYLWPPASPSGMTQNSPAMGLGECGFLNWEHHPAFSGMKRTPCFGEPAPAPSELLEQCSPWGSRLQLTATGPSCRQAQRRLTASPLWTLCTFLQVAATSATPFYRYDSRFYASTWRGYGSLLPSQTLT